MSMHKLSSMILAGAVVAFAVVAQAAPITIPTVPVGNTGNTGELSGASAPGGYGSDAICGAVNYLYQIGKYEVTAGQYTAFLNAVAKTDTYGLYDTYMWSSDYGCKIQQTGSSGSYTYAVAADRANRPVNYVSWGDAARFCNWLSKGQPTGAQNLSTTEDGSYYLNGAKSDAALMAVTRKPGATWVIPTENEWYKAAYHKNDGNTGNYFDYPTGSNTQPSKAVVNPDPGNNANYFQNDYSIGSPYWTTPVGEFENSESPYGTFDQGGNVWEWNETPINSWIGIRGGCATYGSYALLAASRGSTVPTMGYLDRGFRVASLVPEPGSIILLVSGAIAALILWRRRK